MSERACVPVIDCCGQFLYRTSMETAQRWCARGVVVEVPWNRTHAVMAQLEHEEYVKSSHPRFGERYTHARETQHNVRGVWTFKKVYERETNSA